jgi:hypothetical protein
MFGQYLELALATPDIVASLHFYEQIGYRQLPCTDSWPHPYCALSDGQSVIGLHRRDAPATALCFTHADLASHQAVLTAAGLVPLDAQLREDRFHQLSLQAPDLCTVSLLEARTYSPAAIRADASLCGTLLAWSLPTPDMDVAAAYWERAGLIAFAEQELPWPHRPLTGDGLNLALHRPGHLAEPALVYTAANLPQRLVALRALDLPVAAWSPRELPGVRGAQLRAPEGTLIVMLPD